ncbi:hypothetical protein [Paenibacillus rigui]|uniref:Lipoprotein n=1 Tax=Paenibacillus rigui TaxID=554312 RepID=A0A229UIV9_9BACL|nr:hypothetical protein [Paenibacillus rigui]OXM83312.1 hypothetical protein CF651_26685 [Paenibacillus rigui]
MKKTITIMCIAAITILLTSCKKDNIGPLNLNGSPNENRNEISETSVPKSPSSTLQQNGKKENIETEPSIEISGQYPKTSDAPKPAAKEPVVANRTSEQPTPQPTNQDFKSLIPTGWHILEKSKDKPAIAEGDLNKDGIPDVAAVIEKTETTGGDSPRSLMITFGTGNGNYTLSIIADHVVLRAHDGGPHGDPFEDILIDRGSVVLSDFGGSRWKWSDKYRFRFQNNDWYLIGLTQTSYDGATAATDEDDYNLLTGDFIQTKTDSGTATPVITKGNRGPKTVLLREFKADIAH